MKHMGLTSYLNQGSNLALSDWKKLRNLGRITRGPWGAGGTYLCVEQGWTRQQPHREREIKSIHTLRSACLLCPCSPGPSHQGHWKGLPTMGKPRVTPHLLPRASGFQAGTRNRTNPDQASPLTSTRHHLGYQSRKPGFVSTSQGKQHHLWLSPVLVLTVTSSFSSLLFILQIPCKQKFPNNAWRVC